MSLGKEPLDDDMLDSVSGGTTVNSDECTAYAFNGVGSSDGTCGTCLRSGTPRCPYGK